MEPTTPDERCVLFLITISNNNAIPRCAGRFDSRPGVCCCQKASLLHPGVGPASLPQYGAILNRR